MRRRSRDSVGSPDAAPTEDSETSRGFAPASAADMAALRAAGHHPVLRRPTTPSLSVLPLGKVS